MAFITSQNAAQAIVKLVAAQALPALVGSLVMGNLVNRDYESSLQAAGDQINISIPPVLTTTNIAEGGSVNYQTANLGNAQITLNYHQESSFQIPNVTKAIVTPDLIQTLMNPAIIALAEKIETDLLALYPNFTVNTPTGGVSGMDDARIDSAETTLFAQKVPKSQPRYLIVSGTAYGQLRQIAAFRDWNNLGPSGQPSPIITGVLPGGVADGKLRDFMVYRSQYISKPSTTTYNLAFAKDGIALVVRKLPLPMPGTGAVGAYAEMGNFGLRVIMSYDSVTLSDKITIDVLYGCGVLRNNFGVQVQSN
jgi:hypothetical protein